MMYLLRRRAWVWALAGALGALALYPLAKRADVGVALRVQRLGPLLASWETVGGCGAGGGGAGSGGVRWVGRNTRGGLFQTQVQSNYVQIKRGYNFITTAQIARDIDEDWTIGFVVPFLYKYYRNYYELDMPVDVSNGGLGDVNLMVMRKFGPINATSLTASLGFPTGEHLGVYKLDMLTQDKQLGFSEFTGGLTLDHIFDQVWGLVIVGGSAAYRGGLNETTASYRAPNGSVYSHVGYFMGPFVSAAGLTLSAWTERDRDRGSPQVSPMAMAAVSASLEWSNDLVAILAGFSVPYGSSSPTISTVANGPFAFQPWTVSLGLSLSPF